MKKIVLTGGGTAGHVTPNIALIPFLKEAGYEIHYIGSYEGIEKKLISDLGIPYYGIASGKLRRYLSLKNLTDPFRVIKGFSQAKKLMKEINPDVVFSKGGFVTVPVVMAADKFHIPAIIHESDMTPGLANKLCRKHAVKVCCNFPETVKLIPDNKGVLTGSPIRRELLLGDRAAGLKLCGFNTEKPVIMVIGGSLGALHINEAIRNILHDLLSRYQVIHICGKGKVDESFYSTTGYYQFEYVNEELKDLFAAANVVVSRAGANVICELLALKKPSLLIPLPANASRGDQILNARSFKKSGYSDVLEEEDMTDDTLLEAINNLYENREKYIDAMTSSKLNDSINVIIDLINKNCR
ncbi:MAG: undecaprenyldiphospho-muramoylpentapeptide beta-N-acetylglucosaminyltransferase [Butyrivibrio sp.]